MREFLKWNKKWIQRKKKRLKEASKSDSSTWPLDYTTPNEESTLDRDSIARCEAKPKELEDTCESGVQPKLDSPQKYSFLHNNGEDDAKDYTIAITPNFLITDSLSTGDEHLDTILEKESDEFIKSSVENLVANPSESADECECDVPDCDDSQTTNFSTFFNPLFDDSTSSHDESSHEE
nr:hypothetical protein [Tanacetum cinerariifolium]